MLLVTRAAHPPNSEVQPSTLALEQLGYGAGLASDQLDYGAWLALGRQRAKPGRGGHRAPCLAEHWTTIPPRQWACDCTPHNTATEPENS